ncbi:DNA-directed RNA polymerase subunit omega [Alloiococcus otitis]|uniref:DNA-directed RNA polymerase subunit omega n=1 Tax=Alloiococcus otitis ATCC 51267 TaxID=883081 RepID=K9ET82_9LACT|nr:DNA-directed RNA polymerase subunit omega [Alloiococcus otitis]EKU94202.1 DNA-directed RNA polymerase, omega subunit [Alloiococcus otitis ATCC 51267]SUU81165.1 DNA-directed RNA polymerase subunit omega [Alloiococcus otitis]
MLLEPSLDRLMDRIDSQYSLVMLAAKRAHQLDEAEDLADERLLDHYKSERNIGKALEEIESGDLVIDSSKLKGE